ncbi:MAG: cell wall hydrolase [Novosphingobium sp.]
MSRKLDLAGMIALAATLTVTLISTQGSPAAAKASAPYRSQVAIAAQTVGPDFLQNSSPSQNSPEALNSPEGAAPAAQSDDAADVAQANAPLSAASLADLISQTSIAAPLSRELNCLAGAIYFESKSEPLTGQLAVGRVIVARSRSGRFPNSYCGVVYQHSQFSFVRGSAMPAINTASRGWKNALAIAQIADEGSWHSPVEGALFFHAARVSPRWHAARIAQVGNHVFYR